MQHVAKPPSSELVQKAMDYARGQPGYTVRMLTMDGGDQRVVVLYRAIWLGRECPHYYDPELGKECPINQYPNLGKGRVVSSVQYNDQDYRKSVDAFSNYKVLAEGGIIVRDGSGKTG